MEQIIYYSRRVLTIIAGISISISAFLLIFHGDWWAIGYGLLAILAPLILRYLFMPAAFIRGPALYFMDKQKPVMAALSLLAGGLYEWLIISLWFCGVIFMFMQYTNNDDFLTDVSFAYGISLAPWVFISERLRLHETVGDAQRFFIMVVHIAYLVVAAAICLNRFSPLYLMIIFTLLTLIGSLIGSSIAWVAVRKTV